jgi:uncharacterized delta-60 repeat protein
MHRRSSIAFAIIALSLLAIAASPALAARGPLQLDTSFGKRGVVTDPEAPADFEAVQAMTVAPGRTIYVAAESVEEPGTVVIAHYWRDGELETSFGDRGYLTLPGFGPVNALAADNAGRLLVLSQRTTISRITGGHLDPSFGNGGSVNMATLGLGSLHLWSLASLSGNEVAAAGITFGSPQMAVVKLDRDGALDTSFNGTGSRVVRFGPDVNSGAFQLKEQGDGKLVLGGYAGHGPALARLLPDGTLDPQFGRGGRVRSPHRLRGQITALTIRRDDSILAGASGWTRARVGSRAMLLRYSPTGVLDRRFGGIAAPDSRSGYHAVPIAVMRTRRHIFLAISGHGTSIRAYRLNGTPLHLGQVPRVPRDLYFHIAAAPQDRKLIMAWTPNHSPGQGVVHLARFVVR